MRVNWVDAAQRQSISADDRGLLYGDGLFETMAVVDGEVPLWDLHAERLQAGCRRLRLACPSLPELHSELVTRTGGTKRAILKLILTRGVGGRGYAIDPESVPSVILQLHPWPELPQEYWTRGVKVRFCSMSLARQPALAGIKHLNRLEQVLARAEWTTPDIQEGLLADSEGYVIEAVSHNLFVLEGQTFATPDLDQCGVAGVMRGYILDILRQQGCEIRITRLDRHALVAADAVFLCNSIHGIWPVCELETRHYAENRLLCELRDEVARLIPYP